MLSQVRAISFEVTRSALEAALLESDEIKRHRPPYNIALTDDNRRVWFASPDLGEHSPRPSPRCSIGPFPSADVHFYSFIYHDWTPEKCRFLTEKSFATLPSGGHIMIHEMLYNDEKTGPFPIAALSMIMLGWTEGEQYSLKELSEMLREAGFTDIEVKPTFGYWSIVTALKP